MQNEVEMVPEQPPRRSKSDKEPVTIDLKAEETNVIAEPVRSTDTDESVTPAEQVIEASSGTAETPKSASADQPASEFSSASEPPIPPEAYQEPARVAPAPVPRQSPATSTLLAAGVVGGIIALLLAGSMQYAGYLPSATSAGTSGNSAALSEIAALRQDILALKSRPAAPDASLAGRIQALEGAVAKGASGDMTQRLAALERQVNDVKSSTEMTAASDADLARRLSQAESKINDHGPEQQVARAVGAAALKAAIDRGGPFDTELQTFATVAGNDPAVTDLQKFAKTGVPSRAELQRQFAGVADAMLEAVAQPDPNQGIAGRLLSSALSVVKVRRVGDVQGETPEAVVARMEEGLRNGNLQAAIKEWDALPQTAKAVSREFKQKLDARVQVENLVSGTLARAVAGTQG